MEKKRAETGTGINKILRFLIDNKKTVVNVLVLILIFIYLVSYFKPEFMLSKTSTSGGDTGSMIYLAKYMHEYLLPHGKISGWSQDRWLGFPIFQFQFPLAYVLMAFLSYAIPMEVAFKLVTALGIFTLPLFTFLAMRFMKFRFPTPIIAAIFSLFFIFNESNTVFGGNIPSMLAGEFSYSISFSFMVLFIGFMYKKINEKKFSVWLPVLFSIVLFTHIVTAVIAALSALFFVITKNRKKFFSNFKYLFVVFILSFLILSFWILPLIANVSYTTQYGRNWGTAEFFKWYPVGAIIFHALAAIAIYIGLKKDRRIQYFLFILATALFGFINAEHLFTANIRFWPMMYFFVLILSACAIGRIFSKIKLRGNIAVPFVAIIITVLYLNSSVSFIDDWTKWNYEGYESKVYWRSYKEINDFIRESPYNARSWNDLEDLNNRLGTPRAFEALPYFSGKPTIEGVYAQATISSPFISYTQCELSKHCAGIPTIAGRERATVHNLTAGTTHAAIMNVKYFIAVSPTVKEDFARNPDWKIVERSGDWEIYELLTHNGSYVYVPEHEPNAIRTKGVEWKNISLEWWTQLDKVDVPIVFSDDDRFVKAEGIDDMERIKVDNDCIISDQIFNEEIRFSTSCVGKPHIIKVSQFPKWHAEGADKIYLVSPSFMLVYPEQENVRLYYADTTIDIVGKILTIIGLIIIILVAIPRKNYVKDYFESKIF